MKISHSHSQSWADAFRSSPSLAGVVYVYDDLRRRGLEFPMTDLDALSPIHTPNRVRRSAKQEKPIWATACREIYSISFWNNSDSDFILQSIPENGTADTDHDSAPPQPEPQEPPSVPAETTPPTVHPSEGPAGLSAEQVLLPKNTWAERASDMKSIHQERFTFM